MKTRQTHYVRTSLSRLALLLVMGVFLLGYPQTFAQTTVGPNNAGAGTNVAIGSNTDWSNPGNITTVGTPYATVANGIGATSDYLRATNFGFSIPSGATINGIQVVVNRNSTQSLGYGNRDNEVKLVKNNVIQTTNKAVIGTNNSAVYPTSFATQTYGGALDLWGTTWTPADINNTAFGVVLSVYNTRIAGSATATVDYMQITVTYTCITPSINIQPASQTKCVGSSATFSVTATGDNLTYQWRKGTSPLAIGATYTIAAVTLADAATDYNVIVSNSCGSVTSNNVSLTVHESPSASVQSQKNISCFAGTDGIITILANGGTAPYEFSVNNGAPYTAGTNPYLFGGLQANTPYKIRVKDANGCESILIP